MQTVVLLHGWTCSILSWAPVIRALRDEIRVVAYDQRGHGASDTPGCDGYSIEALASDLAAVLDWALRPGQKAVLAGHSMGGMIAAWATAHDPQIRGVGLISAADMAGRTRVPDGMSAEDRKKALAKVAAGLAREGLAPLAGCTPESLAAELMAHAQDWALPGFAAKLCFQI